MPVPYVISFVAKLALVFCCWLQKSLCLTAERCCIWCVLFITCVGLQACSKNGQAPETSMPSHVSSTSAPSGSVTVTVAEVKHPNNHTKDSVSEVMIEHAWVRALPSSQKNTAAYLNVVNTSAVDQVLVAVHSPAAETVEMHTVLLNNEQLQMREMSDVVIEPGQRSEFKPGGQHLMLLGLKAPLQENAQVPLELIFKSGIKITTHAQVRKDAATDAEEHSHH